MPSVKGSANGLRNKPRKAAPTSDSEAPTNPAIATRGSLIFIIMFSCILIDSGTVELNKNPLKIASVSLRGILTVPIDTPKIITLIKSVIKIGRASCREREWMYEGEGEQKEK